MDINTFEYEDSLGVTRTWDVRKLWKASARLPILKLPISKFQDKVDMWLVRDTEKFNPKKGIVSLYLDDFDRIRNADLRYPIILMSNGLFIMDGMHRLMKWYLSGSDTVLVVQFKTDPPPDKITPLDNTPPLSKW